MDYGKEKETVGADFMLWDRRKDRAGFNCGLWGGKVNIFDAMELGMKKLKEVDSVPPTQEAISIILSFLDRFMVEGKH